MSFVPIMVLKTLCRPFTMYWNRARNTLKAVLNTPISTMNDHFKLLMLHVTARNIYKIGQGTVGEDITIKVNPRTTRLWFTDPQFQYWFS